MYSTTEISKALEAAYTHLRNTTHDVHSATETHAGAQLELVTARNNILREYAEDPKSLGGNEAARAATLDLMTAIERQELQEKAESLRTTRDAQELARMEVELWTAQLRCVEAGVAGLAQVGGGAR